MTITNLINKVKEEKPNTFTNEKLLSFINEIEADVVEQFNESFDPYDYNNEEFNPDETELRAPAPYDRLYVSYLKAMIDYANEEYASYQLNAEQHTMDFTDLINWIVRENLAIDYELPSRFRNIF